MPGYAEAVARETRIRDEAFFDVCERICGVEVLPLTPELADALQAVESPFFVGRREPVETDVALFFWICSPQFVPGCRLTWWKPSTWIQKFKQSLRQRRVIASIRHLNFGEACKAIEQYVDLSFIDAPGGSKQRRISFVSWKASLIHFIAEAYGWDEQKIRTTSFKKLFQYQRSIRLSRGMGPLINPYSDRVRADFLKARNAAKRQQQPSTVPTRA